LKCREYERRPLGKVEAHVRDDRMARVGDSGTRLKKPDGEDIMDEEVGDARKFKINQIRNIFISVYGLMIQ